MEAEDKKFDPGILSDIWHLLDDEDKNDLVRRYTRITGKKGDWTEEDEKKVEGILKDEKSQPLLHQFIHAKITGYEEPSRKGTARGEPIGFDLKKYFASLSMLYRVDRNLKPLAKLLGISYGLLRKWRSEEAFKKLFEKHQVEFISYIINTVVGWFLTKEAEGEAYFNAPLEQVIQNSPPDRRIPQKWFTDCDSWDDLLHYQFYKILEDLGEIIPNLTKYQIKLIQMTVLQEIERYIRPPKPLTQKKRHALKDGAIESAELYKKALKRFQKSILDDVEKLLSDPKKENVAKALAMIKSINQ